MGPEGMVLHDGRECEGSMSGSEEWRRCETSKQRCDGGADHKNGRKHGQKQEVVMARAQGQGKSGIG